MPAAAEPADDGQFTVTLSKASDTDTVISYTVSGDATRRQRLHGPLRYVTITAGSTTATIDVTVIDDNLLEDNETVTVTLDSITSGDADITIGGLEQRHGHDQRRRHGRSHHRGQRCDGRRTGRQRPVHRHPVQASDTDTVISYTVTGDATAGSDYTALSGTVTIMAGSTTATIDVTVIDDNLLEDNETVTVTLDSITSGDADITIGASNSDTVTISDEDTAEVTIAANDASGGRTGRRWPVHGHPLARPAIPTR